MLEKGDHVITTNLEHNSVLRPLYHMSQSNIIEVDYIPFDQKGVLDPEDVRKKIKKHTKLVAMSHASNVFGTIQPVKEIGKMCRENEISLVLDASQSAGKIPIDMAEMNVDVVAFTGHKSLMGPTGIGGLYVGENITINLTRAGGTGVRSAVRTHLEEYPYRLEYGTHNIVGIAGLHAGLKWVLDRGIESIHQHEMKLTCMLRDGLRDMEGVALYFQDDLQDHIGVFLFNVEKMEALNVGTILDVDYNIACRTGLHCAPLAHKQIGTDKIHGAVRFGIGPFNTEDHIQTAIGAVKDIAASVRKK
jgi:cysteine desulfurase family protein